MWTCVWCAVCLHTNLQKEGTGLAGLGFMYLRGVGVEKVHSEWNLFHITSVHTRAFAGVTYVCTYVCLRVALQDINKAYTYISQSANSGSVDGHVLLGELFLSKGTLV